jgi:enediyne biosynthesis protein E4
MKMAGSRRFWVVLLAMIVVAGTFFGSWAWWLDRRYKRAMEQIEQEILAGRYAMACRYIDKLLSWKSDPTGGIVYLLGSCELARGRNDAAAKAWSNVTPGSQFSEKAIRGRLRLLHDSGQLTAAERLISEAAADPRNDRTAVRALLVPMYRELGLIDEAERLIEERWEHLNALDQGALEPAINLVLEHVDLTLKVLPLDTTRGFLDRVAKLAPDDDRIWLGRANLAIRTGDENGAKAWLDACQSRRPDDIAVWRARLDWGMATEQVDVVERTVSRLPDQQLKPARDHQVRAWLAGRRGDAGTERAQLELLVDVEPANSAALRRLAELAKKEGNSQQSADYERRKVAIERIFARYRQLHERKQPIRHARELTQLAETLGRHFESRAFRTIAISNAANRKIRANRSDSVSLDVSRLDPRALRTRILPRALT